MRRSLFILLAAILTIFTQCDTLKNIPTNTSGGLFSLNGNWTLATTSEGTTSVGTVVQVFPGIADGTVRLLNNNTACLRERDVLWKEIKSASAGSFIIELLVNACNSQTLYKPGTITVLTNDEIRIKSSSASGTELLQTWKRTTQ